MEMAEENLPPSLEPLYWGQIQSRGYAPNIPLKLFGTISSEF
jgi:hypothetical protein